MKKAILVVLLASTAGLAYDSKCRLDGDDCEGIEAARTAWVVVEHAEMWRRTRAAGNLPEALDQTFNITTLASGDPVLDALPSFRPNALLTDQGFVRHVDIAVFAQLPDLSYTMWDWVSGNEGCPPADLASEPLVVDSERCHAFKAHMGWLNSTHFMPQAGEYFLYLHRLAVDRARECATMGSQLGVAEVERPDILQACDREALLIEAQAHHYLQDAWSMGHMWERWGSPGLDDFQRAVNGPAGLVSLKAIGDAVGRASGIIHGAKALTHLADSMCAPHDGVEFVVGSSHAPGVGDLFMEELYENARFAPQRAVFQACAITAMREVYGASAQSFGEMGPSPVGGVDLTTCFGQRATNRAIALGAAVEFPLGLVPAVAQPLVTRVSNEWLTSLGLDLDVVTGYVPLTSEALTSVNFFVEFLEGEPLIAEALLGRWHLDMAKVQARITRRARLSPETTELAEGDLGSLLGMKPNAAYSGIPSYADPPLPWRPEPNDGGPILPSIENAGNLLARTFVDAHATDWCEAMTRNEPHEFSLERLRRECDSEGDGCAVCEKFASWHLSSAQLGDTPLCEVIAPGSVIIAADFIDAESRADLASQWCRNAPRVSITGRGLVSPDEVTFLTAAVIGVDEQGVTWSVDDPRASISGIGGFQASEPGGYVVFAESVELPGLLGGFFVDVRDGASLVGRWSGDSLSFDGQDEFAVGSPGTITFSIALIGDVATLSHDSSTYPLTIENGRLTGTNGRTDAGRRDLDATVVDDTMIGVITIQETPPSRIEFDVVKQ